MFAHGEVGRASVIVSLPGNPEMLHLKTAELDEDINQIQRKKLIEGMFGNLTKANGLPNTTVSLLQALLCKVLVDVSADHYKTTGWTLPATFTWS